MSAVGVARAAPPFLLGFDVLEPVTDAMLRDAVSLGMRFAGQYLNNLTASTRDRIFGAGLAILPYTEAITSVPLDTSSGRFYGENMTRAAVAFLSMPPGVHVAIDLEDPFAGSDVPAHVNAMSGELVAGGLGAALYVGVPQPLASHPLYLLRPDRYIKGGGRIVDASGTLAEPDCGWCALQLEPLGGKGEGLELGGVPVDVAITKLDYKGRALTLWWPS